MAQQIPTLEAAPGQAGVAPPKKGKLGLLLAIVAVLVVGGGGAAAYFVLGGHKDPKATAAQKAKEAEKTPALYVALDPPFVVNFEAEQLVRFLQVTVQVMSRDPVTAELIKTNDPVVRNDLLLLLGNQSYATISSRDGKEKLRQQALEAVRKVVTGAGGKAEKVEAIYFTSFVMQ
ncbi:MAG: flagellar basal body-associated FliL family protein [Gammaproteobacteria bacterium]